MDYFDVRHLSGEKLLSNWKWLCPDDMSLIARNAFGDLFLQSRQGSVFKLDISIGELTEIAESASAFRRLASVPQNRKKWFAEEDELAASERGLCPDQNQCIAFKVPLIFKESEGVTDNAYVGDLYESVSFLGDLHRQLSTVPEGGKIKLNIGAEPKTDL